MANASLKSVLVLISSALIAPLFSLKYFIINVMLITKKCSQILTSFQNSELLLKEIYQKFALWYNVLLSHPNMYHCQHYLKHQIFHILRMIKIYMNVSKVFYKKSITIYLLPKSSVSKSVYCLVPTL